MGLREKAAEFYHPTMQVTVTQQEYEDRMNKVSYFEGSSLDWGMWVWYCFSSIFD